MRHLHFGKLFFVVFSLLLAYTVSARKPIKTLLITGQNNHNWQVSHVVLKQILENSGRFDVDFVISPEQGKDMSGFVLDFSPYQLVVLDYNGDSWPEETNRRFLEYVQNGGGVVIYHAADNAFSKWPEFNRICALGGWEGRNENSGPYVYWKDGKLVKDSSAGPGGSHGRQHEYVLNGRDKVHPVVKGLPLKWRHAKDELYDRMRGPGNIRDILYTAYSDKETNGSGREEPLVFTVDYGNARIFHTMLGHAGATTEDNIAMQCTGFQVLFASWRRMGGNRKSNPESPERFPDGDYLFLSERL